MSHTKGPWFWQFATEGGPTTRAVLVSEHPSETHRNAVVLAVREDCINAIENGETGMADSFLIAAAPEMFAALEACVEHLASVADDGAESAAIDKARAALARARGESRATDERSTA